MRSRDRLFETLTVEGALLPSDFLQRLAQRDREVPGLSPDAYHLGSGERINEAISRSWNRLLAIWKNFANAVAELPASDLGTTLTREKWMLPFFQELGYGRLSTARPFEFEGRRYSISHIWQNTPIHLVSFRADLDARSENIIGARTTTPHSMVQEFLNRSEGHLWGIVSNGYRLRLLRDNVSLTRQAYVEFDLQSMMQGEVYADFALLWLLLHQSRVEGGADGGPPQVCWLEKWTQEARQRGARALDQLRAGVEEAVTALGSGFLAHPANTALRDQLNGGSLTKQDYFRQLLRIVYRFLFLFVTEDRELLFADQVPAKTREQYLRHYSLTRLRRMALRMGGTQHADLWHVVRLVFRSLGSDTGCAALGLPALGSFLWSNKATPDLNDAQLANRDLLQAIRALAFAEQNRVRRPIDYKNIGTEELGSVYESLLEQHPDVHVPTAKFTLGTHAGHERKTTGSYYTPPSLVQCLLDSALEPVVQERLKTAERLASGEWRVVSGEIQNDPTTRAYVYSVLSRLGQHHGAQQTAPQSPEEPAAASGARRIAGGGEDVLPLAAPHSPLTPDQVARLWDSTPLPTRRSLLAAEAILSLKVCDPACGSGHFLIAAAHRLARHLASARTGEDEPPPAALRHALRDVIGRCIYGVDINPMAVELCKFALWLEAVEPGKPLSFLDHHIQCGNSLIGTTPALMQQGIPDKAFEPIEGDDKKYCAQFRKANKEEATQMQLFAQDNRPWEHLGNLAVNVAQLASLPDETVADVHAKERRYAELVRSGTYESGRQLADAWCAAFVWKKRKQSSPDAKDGFDYPITNEIFRRLERNPRDCPPWMREEIRRLAGQYQFLHWHLAFPEVFQVPTTGQPENNLCGWNGGFDVILSNPPWERIKLQEQEFFAAHDPQIAAAPNKAARKKLIDALPQKNPALHAEFTAAVRAADCLSKFLRQSERYPLTATGDINTYAIFAETIRQAIAPRGRAGIILPTGIATDATCQNFFADVNARGALASLFDFENRDGLFPAVDSRFKFVALTLRETASGESRMANTGESAARPSPAADFAFFLTHADQLRDQRRRFTLSAEDLALFNPNTHTCPVLRTRADAELTRKIYQRVPVLVREGAPDGNPWGVSFLRMFDMSNDSHLFRNMPGDGLLPLYEAKLMHQFDHRFATYDADGGTRDTTAEEKANPKFQVRPRYWVAEGEVLARLASGESRMANGGKSAAPHSPLATHHSLPQWLLGFRDICRATDERTAIFSFLPRAGVGNNAPLLLNNASAELQLCLLGNLNAFIFDFCARQKIGGTHMNFFLVEQLPVLPPSLYGPADVAYVGARVLELVYTAEDLRPLFEAVRRANGEWRVGPDHSPLATRHSPFTWDETRRAQLRAELDAWFARAYGLTRDELRYILDPADVYGPDFPGETFRVLKEKELGKFGEYRTRRLVLEAWDKLPAP